MDENNSPGELRSVFNLSDYDKFYLLGEIETGKTNFWNVFYSSSLNKNKLNLMAVHSKMNEFINKYFMEKDAEDPYHKIKEYKINGFDFYQYKDAVPIAPDQIHLKLVAERSFDIYNYFARQVGSEIPTVKTNSKKKLIQRLFSIVNDPELPERLIKEYEEKLKICKIRDRKNNFYAYCLSRMREFDLDSFNIIFGFARIGKSNEVLILCKLIIAFRNNLTLRESERFMLEKGFLKKSVIHSDKQSIKEAIMENPFGIVVIDEGYVFADKREAMTQKLIGLTHDVNTNADQNLIWFVLIQREDDLDYRFTDKANSILGLTKRGLGILFSVEKNFAMIKDLYNFEFIRKHPNLMSDYIRGMHTLRQLKAFVYSIRHKDIEDSDLFKAYKLDKRHWKRETTTIQIQIQEAQQNRDLEFIKRYKS